MSDISYWDEDLTSNIEKLDALLKQISSANGAQKTSLLQDADDKMERINQLKKSYNLEMRQLANEERQTYQTKLREHESRIKALQTALKWEKTGAQKPTDVEEGAGDNVMTGDAMLQQTVAVQGKTEMSLNHTLQMVAASKEVGHATATELERQREQIRDITDQVMQIEDNLTRADKLIRTFTRRMATDRVIMFFAFLIVVALVAVIIVSVAGGDDSDNGKDVPPDPLD